MKHPGRRVIRKRELHSKEMCMVLSCKTACSWDMMKSLGFKTATEEHWTFRNQRRKRKDSEWAEMTPVRRNWIVQKPYFTIVSRGISCLGVSKGLTPRLGMASFQCLLIKYFNEALWTIRSRVPVLSLLLFRWNTPQIMSHSLQFCPHLFYSRCIICFF